MTREEREAAIAYIKTYRKLDEDLHNTAPKDSISYYATDKCLKYWDMAIKALSQEPTDTWSIKDVADTFKKHGLIREQEPCTDAVSRQAVIYYIKGHIHEIITESGADKNAHTNSILRALINGVETMPPVNPQPCDDAISREAVIQRVCEDKFCYKENCKGRIYKRCPDIMWVYELPSVTQKSETVTEFADRCRECGAKYGKLLEQKSGKWIPLENRIEWGERVKCSECDQVFIVGDDISRHFCPNCGARMESEENNG